MQAALLKMATPAVTFGTVCPIFCRVNAIFLAHSPKTSGGPGPPREVVLARLKSGPRTRVSAIFFFFDFNVLYNRRKIMLILCWSISPGDFSKEFYVKA